MAHREHQSLSNRKFAWFEIDENAEIQFQINKLYNDWYNLCFRLNLAYIESKDKSIEGLEGQVYKRKIEINQLINAYNRRVHHTSFIDVIL